MATLINFLWNNLEFECFKYDPLCIIKISIFLFPGKTDNSSHFFQSWSGYFENFKHFIEIASIFCSHNIHIG